MATEKSVRAEYSLPEGQYQKDLVMCCESKKLPEVNFQTEVSKSLDKVGIDHKLELKWQLLGGYNLVADISILEDNEVKGFIEVKNHTDPRPKKYQAYYPGDETPTKQLQKYLLTGYPVFLIGDDTVLEDCIDWANGL